MPISTNTINNSTIAAIATVNGNGGIGIVRLSGQKSLEIAKKIIRFKNGDKKEITPRFAHFCFLKTDEINDQAIVIYFKSPNSFTGEDVVEIQCHGNSLISSLILKALIKNGASLAEPGEFTKRAFLNGKIDLSSAESVLDIINAESIAGVNMAFDGLSGVLREKIENLSNNIKTIIAELSAGIDYPEDDIIESSTQSAVEKITILKKKLKDLENSYNSGSYKKNGVRVAIIGSPNVGKSMLLNSLVGYERAIVSSKAGTTRDTIDASYNYKDVLFNIIDTAGIRDTKSNIENLGIKRSKQILETADILLCVSEPNIEFNQKIPDNKLHIFVKNKCDLECERKNNTKCDTFTRSQTEFADKLTKNSTQKSGDFAQNSTKSDNILQESEEIANSLTDSIRTQKCQSALRTQKVSIDTSALTNKNIDLLKDKIFELTAGSVNTGGVALNNARHLSAVTQSIDALNRAIDNFKNFSIECMLSDLNIAFTHLGSITGTVATDAVVDEIFKNFCVGK